MAKAYSDDLRRKILGAYDRKAGSLRELSERFCVSYAWARKISWQRRRTGQMERVEQRHGSPSRATAEVKARLRSLLREQPDRTLVELQQGLGEAEGVHFSIQHLWRLLRRMSLPLKKVAPCPGARHAGKSAAARGVAGTGKAGGSPAVGVCG
jgi:transposase